MAVPVAIVIYARPVDGCRSPPETATMVTLELGQSRKEDTHNDAAFWHRHPQGKLDRCRGRTDWPLDLDERCRDELGTSRAGRQAGEEATARLLRGLSPGELVSGAARAPRCRDRHHARECERRNIERCFRCASPCRNSSNRPRQASQVPATRENGGLAVAVEHPHKGHARPQPYQESNPDNVSLERGEDANGRWHPVPSGEPKEVVGGNAYGLPNLGGPAVPTDGCPSLATMPFG